MSIVDKGSVLLIGAGASADFGLPLGETLINDIMKATNKTQSPINGPPTQSPSPNYWGSDLADGHKGMQNPIGATVIQALAPAGPLNSSERLTAARSKAYAMGQELLAQTSETIDDFISLNPQFSEIAKLCIAGSFAGKLFKSAGTGPAGQIKPLEARMSESGARNWIHLLINIVRHGRRGRSDERRIPIISFNYDGILEYVLEKQFSNIGVQMGRFDEHFEILHPHGFCGNLPGITPSIWKTATEWAKNIWVVNEDPAALPESVRCDRNRSRRLIENAERIYAAGFSFSHPNCELLGLNKRDQPFEIRYHNYNNDIGIDVAVGRIAKRWGLSESQLSNFVIKGAGSEGRGLSIANWIKGGHLGAMPG